MELVKSKIEEAKEKAKESGIDATGGAGAAWTGLQQWIKSTVPEDAQDKVRRFLLADAESLCVLTRELYISYRSQTSLHLPRSRVTMVKMRKNSSKRRMRRFSMFSRAKPKRPRSSLGRRRRRQRTRRTPKVRRKTQRTKRSPRRRIRRRKRTEVLLC